MTDAIVAEGLTRRFGDKLAVDALDLRIKQGEVYGLLGHNGAGKTTTVRLLNGVLEPTSGRASVLGLDPMRDGPRLRRQTGVLTETPAADDRLTGRENLRAYGEMYDLPDPGGRADELLRGFDLAAAADQRVSTYSKGMRQRVALARTLLHDPAVLFLDEPTSGLDPVAAHQVHALIERLARVERRTVLLCTHNLTEAARLCDRVAVLRRGRAIAEGPPAVLARSKGGTGRVAVEIPAADHEKAVAALRQAGVKVERVAPVDATLEDYYLSLDEEGRA